MWDDYKFVWDNEGHVTNTKTYPDTVISNLIKTVVFCLSADKNDLFFSPFQKKIFILHVINSIQHNWAQRQLQALYNSSDQVQLKSNKINNKKIKYNTTWN